MAERQKCSKYDKAFKFDAIRLVIDERRSVTEIARDLGINPKLL